jgi:hypothetical protein
MRRPRGEEVARTLQAQVTSGSRGRVQIGAQLLEAVTSGMYSDPLMVLREYVQNAADSLDEAEDLGLIRRAEGRVEIRLEGKTRSIAVEDNGLGVPRAEVRDRLGSLGYSTKDGVSRRGFRGIGRLGGLAYCQELCFETRTRADEAIAMVVWNGAVVGAMASEAGSRGSLQRLLRGAVALTSRPPLAADPPRFLRVTMKGVRPFHDDALMNVRAVRSYLSQVAPVPFDPARFAFARKLDAALSAVPGYRAYHLTVNGDVVCRPHADVYQLSKEHSERVRDVRLLNFMGADGRVIGKGWYAVTDLPSSIPPTVPMRGIRILQGNIAVGTETCLEDCFRERRFATWHIGQVHLDTRLRLNARRDWFEHSQDLERFLEQAGALGAILSGLCRSSSEGRSALRSLEARCSSLERRAQTALFLDTEHRRSHWAALADDVQGLTREVQASGDGALLQERLERLCQRISEGSRLDVCVAEALDGRRLRGVSSRALLLHLSRLLLIEDADTSGAAELLGSLLAPYLKAAARERLHG